MLTDEKKNINKPCGYYMCLQLQNKSIFWCKVFSCALIMICACMETHEFIFSWLSWLAELLVGAYRLIIDSDRMAQLHVSCSHLLVSCRSLVLVACCLIVEFCSLVVFVNTLSAIILPCIIALALLAAVFAI